MRSTGTVGLASWSSPTGISQMAYRLLHIGLAHHVLCRTCTLRRHSRCRFWHVLDHIAVALEEVISGDQWLHHRQKLWVRQATIQTVALIDETFSPCSSLYHTSHIYVLVSPPLLAGLFEKYFENTTPSCSLKLCDSYDVCNLLGLVSCRSVHLWYIVCIRTYRQTRVTFNTTSVWGLIRLIPISNHTFAQCT